MAQLSIISEEDEEQVEAPGVLSIVSEEDEVTAPEPVPEVKAAMPEVTAPEPLTITSEEDDPTSPLTTIPIGDPEEPGFFGSAWDSFQAWRDDIQAEAKRNRFTKEERDEITKRNVKLNRQFAGSGGIAGFGDYKPPSHSSRVRAGLEEPPEDEVENALIDHLNPEPDKPKAPRGRIQTERERWQTYPKDDAGFLIDPVRNVILSEDGMQLSEGSYTVQHQNRWWNIPSVVNGQQVSEEAAMVDAEKQAMKGWIHPNYVTQEEATQAAMDRSSKMSEMVQQNLERIAELDEEEKVVGKDPWEQYMVEEKPEDPWGTVIWNSTSNVPHLWKRQYGGAQMFLNAPRDLAYILEAASDQGVAPENSFALEVEAYVQGKDPAELYGEMLKEAQNNPDFQEGLRIHKEETEYLKAHQPNVGEDSAKYYIGAIIEGSLNMAPMLVASAVTRSPTVGAAIMGGQVFADQYAESIRAGRSHSEAVMDGTVFASAEILTERIPLGILTKEGGTLLARMLKAGGAEALQEPITQLIQEGYTMGIINEEMTFGEALIEIVTTEEGQKMLKRSAIVGLGVGGTLAGVSHPFFRDVTQEELDELDPTTDVFGRPEKKPKTISKSEQNQQISPEEAKELGLVEVDVTVDLLERVAAGDPLTIDEQYTLTNNGYGRFFGAEDRVMLLPKGKRELESLRDTAAAEEIVMEGEEITIRRAGEAVDIAAPVERELPEVTEAPADLREYTKRVQELEAEADALSDELEEMYQAGEITDETEEDTPQAKRRVEIRDELKRMEAERKAKVEEEPLARRRAKRLFAGEQISKTTQDTDRFYVPERLQEIVGELPELQTHPSATTPTAPRRMVSNEWARGVRERLRKAYPSITDVSLETAFLEGEGIEGLLINLAQKPEAVTAVQNVNAMLDAADTLIQKYDMVREDVAPGLRSQRAMKSYETFLREQKPVIDLLSKDLQTTLEQQYIGWTTDQRNRIIDAFEQIQKLPAAEQEEAANQRLKFLLEQFQKAAQEAAEPPDREGDVIDTEGQKIVVWRGEHGLREDQDEDFQTRVGSLSFGGLRTAATYAREPNNRIKDKVASDPRVRGYTLNITNPLVNTPDDPFVDMAQVRRSIGKSGVRYVLENDSLNEAIMSTGKWQEQFADEYDSPAQVLQKAPERADELYLNGFQLFDDAGFVEMARKKGFDGAIHMGFGENFDEVEYRIFNPDQATPLPEVEIIMEEDEVSEIEVFRSDRKESRASIRARLEAAQRRVEEPKSPEQAEAGNYKKGHMKIDSIPVTIETAKGMIRKGIDRLGRAWEFLMEDAYGYIKGTKSREPDGRGGFDQIDVFVGPYPESGHAVIINQKKDGRKRMSLENFDEHKIMLGYRDTLEAEEGYRRNYTDGGAKMGSVVAMTTAELREWLETADTKTPATLSEVVFVPGRGDIDFRPFQLAIDAAQAYTEANGIEYEPAKERAQLDVRRAEMIAREFDRMEHDPTDPDVAEAYQAMIDETLAQYEYILESGLEIEFIVGKDPYTSPRDAILDIRENNHLWVFPTREGFGTRAEFEAIDNPLLNETKHKISGKVALANDIFRVVHDYFGHLANGFGFRARGEENAWQHHAAMYSPLARRAMTVETRGQNSWVNYGPHGETNRTASAADTVYADQKIGLMPVWVSEEGRLSAKRRLVTSRPKKDGELVAPPVSPEGRITLTHYSSRPDIDRIDPSFYGQGIRGAEAQRQRAYPETWIDRTYYGISPGIPGGYRKEPGLGPQTYTTSIDARLLYDLQADPENLAAVPDLNESEKAIRDAGYSGYWLKHPSMGLVAAVFDPLEVETKKGPTARSRRKTNAGKGYPVEEVQNWLRPVYRMFRNVRPVRVVEAVEDLPKHLQIALDSPAKKRDTTGMYDQGAWEDDIYIVANNVASEAEAIETLLHEVAGHYGLRQIIPPWQFDEFMDLIAKSFPKQVRDVANNYELNWNDVAERRIAAEEFIAHTSQRILTGQPVPEEARSILDKIIRALENVVRWMTGQRKLFSHGQLMSIIAQSSDFVQKPGGYQRAKRRGRLRHTNAPYFYSAVWKAFNETDTKSTSADGWKQFITGQIKKGNMKQVELDWMGLTDGVDKKGKIKSTWLDEVTWNQLFHLLPMQFSSRTPTILDVETLFPRPMFEIYKEWSELTAEITSREEQAARLKQEAWIDQHADVQKQIGGPEYSKEARQKKEAWMEEHEGTVQFLPVNEQRDLAVMQETRDGLKGQLEQFARSKPKKIPVESIQSFIERNGVDIEVRRPGEDEDYGPPDWDETYPDDEDPADEDHWYDWWQDNYVDPNFEGVYLGALDDVHKEHGWDPELDEEDNEATGNWDETDEDEMKQEAHDKATELLEEEYHSEAREEWERKFIKKKWYSGDYMIDIDDDGDFVAYHDGERIDYYSSWEDAANAVEEHYEEKQAAWSQYMVTPKGRDYEVLLFKWTNPDRRLFTEEIHWGEEENYVVHVRFDVRKDEDGNDVFYVDELQSDWHQEIARAVQHELKSVHNKHGYDKRYDNRDGTFGGGPEWDGTTVEAMYEEAREGSLDNPKLKKEWKDKAQNQFNIIKQEEGRIIDEMMDWNMTSGLQEYLMTLLTGEFSDKGRALLSDFQGKVVDVEAHAEQHEKKIVKTRLQNSAYDVGLIPELNQNENMLFAAYRQLRKTTESYEQYESGLISKEEYVEKLLKFATDLGLGLPVANGMIDRKSIEWLDSLWMRSRHGLGAAGRVLDAIVSSTINMQDLVDWDGTSNVEALEKEAKAYARLALKEEADEYEGHNWESGIGAWRDVQNDDHVTKSWADKLERYRGRGAGWEHGYAMDLFKAYTSLSRGMQEASEQTTSLADEAGLDEIQDRFGVYPIMYEANIPKLDDMDRAILNFDESRGAYERYSNGQAFAPFEKDWQLLAMKHIIAEAARRGMPRIYFSKGEVHGVRWDGAEAVAAIDFEKHPLPPDPGPDPTPDMFTGELRQEKRGDQFRIDLAVPGSARTFWVTNKELAKNVGHRVAKAILESPSMTGTVHHEDVGQRNILIPNTSSGHRLTGSRQIYNAVTPNMLNKFLKKFKTKVKETWVPGNVSHADRNTAEREGVKTKGTPTENFERWNNARVRPLSGIEVIRHIPDGFDANIYTLSQDMENPADQGPWGVEVQDDNGIYKFDEASGFHVSREAAEERRHDRARTEGEREWGFEAFEIEMTPKLVETAKQGFPLFHRRGKPKTGDPDLDEALEWADENIGPARKRSIAQVWEKINRVFGIEEKQLKIEQALIDQFAGLKWALRQAHGHELPAQSSAYKQAHFTTSLDSQMYIFMTHGVPYWERVTTDQGTGTVTQIKPGSKGLLEVIEPIADKTELWGYWMAARRANRLIKEGREALFTQDRIDELLKLGEMFPEFQDVADAYNQWKTEFLDWASEAGVINEDTRPLWDEADYVPFYRIKSDEMGGSFAKRSGMGGPGIANVTQPIKRLVGAKHPLGDILENILINFQHIAAATMRNKAAQLAIENLKDTGFITPAKGSDFMTQEFIPLDELKRKLRRAGVDWEAMSDDALASMQNMWAVQKPQGDDFISVLYNGKKKYFKVHEETLLRSLTAINTRAFSSVIGRMFMWPFRKTKRLSTTMITLAPDFMAANWWRDIMMAFVNSRHAKFPKPFAGTSGIWKAFTKSPEMVSMMAAGGAFYSGYINANDPVSTTKALKRALRQTGFKNRILDAPWKIFHLYNDIGAAGENANRIGTAYIPAIKAGAGKAEAVWEAKDLMNFAKHGDHVLAQFFTQSVMFLNARIQGLVRYGTRFREAPGLTFTKSLLYSMATLMLWWLRKDDDKYKALPEEEKDLYHHFWINGKHWRLPKSFEVGMIFGTGAERMMEYYYSNEDDAGKVAIDRMAFIIGEVFNFGGPMFPYVPIPQMIAPLYEATQNWNAFFQAPIVPEYMRGMEKEVPELVYRPSTSPAMRELAEGMPDFAPVMLRDPLMLEHLTRGYFGTLGAYVMMLTDDLVRKAYDYPPRPDLRASQTPIAKRFYRGDDPPSRTMYEEVMYQVRDHARNIQAAINRMEALEMEDEVDTYKEKKSRYDSSFTNEEILEASAAMEPSYKEIKRIRDEMTSIWEDEKMGGEEKLKKLNRLYMDKLQEAKEAWLERPGASETKKDDDEIPVTPPGAIIQFEALQDTLIDMDPEDRPDYLAGQGLGQTADLLVSLPKKPGRRLRNIIWENSV